MYATLKEKIAAEKKERMEAYDEFDRIFTDAWQQASDASLSCSIKPMYVYHDKTGEFWIEREGPCGFAWVNVKPGNSRFARWLVKTGKAQKAYYGGVDIWISDYNQSYIRKKCHADNLARLLRENLDIKATSHSRLD